MEEFSQLKFSLLSSDPDPGLGLVDKSLIRTIIYEQRQGPFPE